MVLKKPDPFEPATGTPGDSEAALQHELRWFRTAIDASPDCIHITDIDALRLLYVNQTTCDLSGYTREEYMRMRVHEITRMTEKETLELYAEAIKAGDAGLTLAPQLISDKHGRRRAWWEVHHRAFQLDGRWLLSSVSSDVTRRVLAEQDLLRAKRMYATLSASHEAIVNAHSADELFQQVCDAAVDIGGLLNAAILMRKPDSDNLEPVTRAGTTHFIEESLFASVDESLPEGQGLAGIAFRSAAPCISNDFLADPRTAVWHTLAAVDGIRAGAALPILRGHSSVGVLLLLAAEKRVFDPETVELLQRIAQNITIALLNIDHEIERERTEERIRYLATHDSLTGVPNRMLFSELLNATIHSAARQKRRFAVMFLDIDNFKQINDTLGHAAGDQLLMVVTRRLRLALRLSDILARMSGDEFVVLLQDVNQPEESAAVARKMLAAIHDPVIINEQEVRISASIGISLYPIDGEDEKTLMQHADTAMYVAKDRGKNNFQFFSG